MRMHYFWAQNEPIAQMIFFFSENLLISLVPFIHRAKNHNQI